MGIYQDLSSVDRKFLAIIQGIAPLLCVKCFIKVLSEVLSEVLFWMLS